MPLDHYPSTITDQPQSGKQKRRLEFIITTVTLSVLISVIGTTIAYGRINRPAVIVGLPSSVVFRASFSVYQFSGEPPLKYRIDPETISLDRGVLIYRLVKPGSPEITITQQAIGSYSNLSRRHSKIFATDYGQANVQENLSRTTGELFTTDKTWIIANSSEPIGDDTMQTVIKALRPTKIN